MMNKWIKRKEFENIFAPFNANGTQIWVISRIKKLPVEIVNMAVRLAKLDFIKYVRMCDETAIGIKVLYDTKYKTIDFYDINSPKKGFGGKMVDAVFQDFSKDWQPAVVMDWSNGFWDRMKEKYRQGEWVL